MKNKRSDYMEWAKTCSTARYNLATSGILSVARSEFSFRADELEITAAGGYGYEPLQEKLAGHAGVPAECVVAATGTSMANHLALAAIIEPGDEVLIEQPAYGPLLEVAQYLGARAQRIERRFAAGFALNLEELARAISPATRVIVLTNLHNPSGALIGEEALRGLGEIAQRRSLHVLVDEAYLEMISDEPVPFAFAIGEGLGGANPFITTNSLTKAYGLSGLRCGWILAEPELAHRIWRLNDFFGVNAAHPAEQISVLAFNQLARFRQRSRELLKINRALLDAFLEARADLECFRPTAGTVAFPRLRSGDVDEFCKLLRDKFETSVVPGRFFEMPQHFRIGIGNETAEVKEGLDRLAAALHEFGRR